jgi:hypothetical protein
MSYPIKYPTPQGANIQIFNVGGSTITDWVKPQGASFVWFTLIGGGAGGDNGDPANGGGSGAVTNFMGPAFLMPDVMPIQVAKGGALGASGGTSIVYYRTKSTFYTLLTASGGTVGSSGGAAMTANYFTAMGFFQSVAGQAGTNGTPDASTTTFLGGGGGGGTNANYGYGGASPQGFFQTQPIIVGAGGNVSGRGGIGCGAGGTGGTGGDGMVVIITW